jgi:hypothetical protein
MNSVICTIEDPRENKIAMTIVEGEDSEPSDGPRHKADNAYVAINKYTSEKERCIDQL